MKKAKKRGPLRLIAVLLVIALLAIAGVMIYKQREYSASEDYYGSLREIATEETP